MKESIFDYVLEKILLSDVIGDYVTLKTVGKTTKGLCPFHNEKTPSFTVSDEKGVYYCFGCKASGNAVTFISEMEKLDKLDAIRYLAEKFKIDISKFDYKNPEKPHNPNILRDAALLFMKFLSETPSAIEYAKKRGINKELIQRFGIGYAKDGWDSLYSVMKKKYGDADLLEAGLINHSKGKKYDKFRNRLMFPIIDQRRRVVGFGGRALGDDPAKYLNSQESVYFKKGEVLYNLNSAKDELDSSKTIIVTEGYMDVVSLASVGIRNVVATLGTALTDAHVKLLSRYARQVIVCYDSDSAGIHAAEKAVDILMPVFGNAVKVCLLGDGLDPDDFVRKNGAEAFRKKIKEARLGLVFQIDMKAKDYNLDDRVMYVEFLKESALKIKRLENVADRALYAAHLIQEYGADEKTVNQMCNVFSSTISTSLPDPKILNINKAHLELDMTEKLIVKYFAKHALDKDNPFLDRILDLELNDSYMAMIYAMVTHFDVNKKLNYAVLAEDAGFEMAQDLQKILESKVRIENIELLLNNRELYWVNKELDTARREGNTNRIQEISLKKQEIIRDIHRINNERSLNEGAN